MFKLEIGSVSIKCIDPIAVKQAMESIGVDSSVISKCNSVELKHGPRPGTGHFLMLQSDFNALADESKTVGSSSFSGSSNASGITLSAFFPNLTIKVIDNFNNGTVTTLNNWTIATANTIYGHPDNPNAIVYVTTEDVRHWLARTYTPNKTYNKIRHTEKNTGVVAGTERYYSDTLKNSNPWNVDQMLDDMVTSSSRPFTWNSSSFLSDYFLLNVVSGDKTLLDWFSRVSQILRCYYYINTSGNIVFDTNVFSESDVSSSPIVYHMKNLMIYPGNPGSSLESQKWPISFLTAESLVGKYYNNESDIVDALNPNNYPTTYWQTDTNPSSSYASQQVNLPHHYATKSFGTPSSTDYLPSSAYWNSEVDAIADRVRANIHPEYRFISIRGYFAYAPRFQGDVVIYSNYGDGLMTNIYGVKEHELDYLTPEFEHYEKELIREYWKYVLKTRFFYPEGYTYGYAEADIYYPITDILRRTDVIIYDLTSSLKDAQVGSRGTCNQIGQYYYANCCTGTGSNSDSSSSLDECGCGSSQIKITVTNADNIISLLDRSNSNNCTYLDFTGFSSINGTYYVDWPEPGESVELGRWSATNNPLTENGGNRICVHAKLVLDGSYNPNFPCLGNLYLCINYQTLFSFDDPYATCTPINDYVFNQTCLGVNPGAFTEPNDFEISLCIPATRTISQPTVVQQAGQDALCPFKYFNWTVAVAPV